ncbi:caspase-14-like [Rhinoraja longicauda]
MFPQDILNSLEKYRDQIESQVCCSFVFILAHGEEGKIKGTDKKKVDLEEVFETFSNENCVLLQSKPKVFVIQACRGDKKDPGVTSGFRSMVPEPEILPTTSDTFIVYPSRPGLSMSPSYAKHNPTFKLSTAKGGQVGLV